VQEHRHIGDFNRNEPFLERALPKGYVPLYAVQQQRCSNKTMYDCEENYGKAIVQNYFSKQANGATGNSNNNSGDAPSTSTLTTKTTLDESSSNNNSNNSEAECSGEKAATVRQRSYSSSNGGESKQPNDHSQDGNDQQQQQQQQQNHKQQTPLAKPSAALSQKAKLIYFSLLQFPVFNPAQMHKQLSLTNLRDVVNNSTLNLLPLFISYELLPFQDQVFELEVEIVAGRDWHGIGLFSHKCLNTCREANPIFGLKDVQTSRDYFGSYCSKSNDTRHFESGYFSNGHICLRKSIHDFKTAYKTKDKIGIRVEMQESGTVCVKYFLNGSCVRECPDKFSEDERDDIIHVGVNVAHSGGEIKLVRACHFTSASYADGGVMDKFYTRLQSKANADKSKANGSKCMVM